MRIQLLCTAQKVNGNFPGVSLSRQILGIFFNFSGVGERVGYHKPIGKDARIVWADGEAGTFAASGCNDIKGTNSA